MALALPCPVAASPVPAVRACMAVWQHGTPEMAGHGDRGIDLQANLRASALFPGTRPYIGIAHQVSRVFFLARVRTHTCSESFLLPAVSLIVRCPLPACLSRLVAPDLENLLDPVPSGLFYFIYRNLQW